MAVASVLLIAIAPAILLNIWGWNQTDVDALTPKLITGFAVWLLLALALLILWVTPSRLWAEHVERISALITPVLQIVPAPSVNEGGSSHHRFWICNPSSKLIPGCYAKFYNYRSIHSLIEPSLPHDGMPLVWDFRTHKSATEASIGANSRELLSFGRVNLMEAPRVFEHIMGPDAEARLNTTTHPLDTGVYEFEVEVGSREAAFPPTRLGFRFIFMDTGFVEITPRSIEQTLVGSHGPIL